MLNKTIKFATSFLCKNFLHNPLSILIYHRVLSKKDTMRPGEIIAEEFDCQMATVSEFFNVLPLPLAIDLLYSNKIPPRSLCITFDDGYADNYTTALPILQKYNLPATFFISSGYLNGGCMWNDKVIESIRTTPYRYLELPKIGIKEINAFHLTNEHERHQSAQTLISYLKYLPFNKRSKAVEYIVQSASGVIPTNLMLSDNQLIELANSGMAIGGHTITHPILSAVNDMQAEKEIRQGKLQLENIIGKKIDTFAYPNGIPHQDYETKHSHMAKEAGFKAAVSTQWGVSTINTDPYQLKRFTPWNRTKWKFLLRLLHNYI